MWKTIVNVFFVSVLGMLLGSRIATPLLFGVAVLALGLQVEAFWFWLVFLVFGGLRTG